MVDGTEPPMQPGCRFCSSSKKNKVLSSCLNGHQASGRHLYIVEEAKYEGGCIGQTAPIHVLKQ